MALQPDSSAAKAPEHRTPTRRRIGKAAAAVVLAASTMLIPSANAVAADRDRAAATAAPGADASRLASGFRQGRVTVDGGQIFYTTGGTGPALVLLHGWPQTWYSWHKVMPELAKRHTVIALDLPGLGQSSIPANGFDKATTARRVREAVRALGHNEVNILSHDLGALVAYNYARDFPNEVKRLAVLETPLSGFGLENLYGISWHFGFNSAPKPVPENIMDNTDVPTYLNWLFDGASHHPEAIARPVYFAAYFDPARRSAGYEYYRAFPADAADNQANAATKQVTKPILAMGAQYTFGPAVAASFRQVGTDVREVVAPDSGHWIPEENPAYLIECATLFFGPAGVPAPRPDLAGCVA